MRECVSLTRRSNTDQRRCADSSQEVAGFDVSAIKMR